MAGIRRSRAQGSAGGAAPTASSARAASSATQANSGTQANSARPAAPNRNAIEHASSGFAQAVIAWQGTHGRHALPWQGTRDPYRVWLSEIMLQQTQVAAVIPYYERFLARFPTLRDLADAPADDVMAHWAGLGYYSRARNLHAAAQRVRDAFGGEFPQDPHDIQSLPGVGRSTAAAIAAFAFGKRAAILDGNVKRVFARYFGIAGFPGLPKVEALMWDLADTQGLMDLGATLCTRAKPTCLLCPLHSGCVALRDGLVDSLPTPKPAKALPHRTTTMPIVLAAGTVWLVKRPARGIWGGLWCLPQCDDDAELKKFKQGFKLSRAAPEALPLVHHGFTHYKLTIQPLLWRLKVMPENAHLEGVFRGAKDAEETLRSARWQPLDALEEIGLPAPVASLLATMLP
jgi:A/G-specific adenine glycosylase